MHDLQTIRFLNSDEQLTKARVRRADDLHNHLLDVLYTMSITGSEKVVAQAHREAVKLVSALYDMAVKGGAK